MRPSIPTEWDSATGNRVTHVLLPEASTFGILGPMSKKRTTTNDRTHRSIRKATIHAGRAGRHDSRPNRQRTRQEAKRAAIREHS